MDEREYKVPFAKPYFDEEEVDAVTEVIRSSRLSQGPVVEEFEKRFAEYIGTKHAVATSNGTTALHLALAAAGVNSGDEVMVPSFTFVATANSVLYQNARPVFVDINSQTYNIDPDRIENEVADKTRAVVPVHYGGQPADMDPIDEIAEKHGLLVVEDAAEAHGAQYKGRKAGSLAHAAVFSFYPSKNMTTGEGGMVTTDDDELAEKMRCLRSHGQTERYHHVTLGYNYRMTELQAAVGIVQLSRLERVVEAKNKVAKRYTDLLSDLGGLETPYVKPEVRHAYMLYTVKLEGRDEVRSRLESEGVETRICFPPIHLQPQYKDRYGYSGGELPITEDAARRVLSLPIYFTMTDAEQDYVVNHLKKALKRV